MGSSRIPRTDQEVSLRRIQAPKGSGCYRSTDAIRCERDLRELKEFGDHSGRSESKGLNIFQTSLITVNNCFSAFSHRRSGREAMAAESEARFRCDVCGKEFITSYSLRRHSRTHTVAKPFPCSECDKKFSQKRYLTVQLRTHSGEKPFACNRCKKTFSHKSSLSAHRRTHTDERPYSCTFFSAKFRQASETHSWS